MKSTIYKQWVVAVLCLGLCTFSCRTATTTPEPAQLKDFDTSANDTIDYKIDRPYEFCSDSKNFNVVNAFWLGIAANFVYAKKQFVQTVISDIRQKWNADVTFVANDAANVVDFDSQAFWIEFGDFVILSFRGTQTSAHDFSTDFQLLSTNFDDSLPNWGQIHKGFKGGLDVIWDKVKPKLATLKTSRKKLFVTGHSLGGALATVAVARIMAQPEFKDSARPHLQALYTYGSPRVGNNAFATAFATENTSMPGFYVGRFRNYADVVTRIPSSRLLIGYKHVGELIYLDKSGRMYSETKNVKFRRLFMPHDISANMIEDFADYRFREFLTKYDDHSMTGYLDKISFDYKMMTEWSKQNNRSVCDMGLYEIAWAQDPKPDIPKPWTNDLPIAVPHADGNTVVKDCCWCMRTWYGSSWMRDKVIKMENMVSVIQEGEIASGSCMYPGGKPMGNYFWQPDPYTAADGSVYKQYYVYSDCEKTTVVGDACVTGAELWINARPSGKTIRKTSWAP